MKKFKKLKNVKINQIAFFKKTIKIKNLLIKPIRGGIPAKDISNKIICIEIDFVPPVNFKSLKLFKYFKSNKKKIVKIFTNKQMYALTLNNKTE